MNMDPSLTYRHSGGQGASPVRLVVLLYEQLIKDVQNALSALEAGNIEQRIAAVNHAFEVAAELQARLDRERGGAVARNLDRFYEVLRSTLLEAQIQRSRTTFENLIANLLSLRDAWVEVERSVEQTAPPAAPSGQNHQSGSPSPTADWTV